MNETNRNDLLAPSPFTLIGLIFALATLILFGLSVYTYAFGLGGLSSGDFGVPSVLTMLIGGLFLLIGGNDTLSGSTR